MGATFYVNGPAPLYYAGALLGWGIDGIEIELTPKHHDVPYDVAGGTAGTPGDVQIMSEEATISGTLSAFDWVTVNSAIRNSRGGVSPGTMPPSGTLLGAGGFLKSLSIPSTLGSLPWNFRSAWLVAPTRVPLGTVATFMSVVFRAIPYRGASDTLAGATLYTH